MCEVTPYMVSVATKCGITVCHGISVIYHSTALLISTTGVVYYIYIYMEGIKGVERVLSCVQK